MIRQNDSAEYIQPIPGEVLLTRRRIFVKTTKTKSSLVATKPLKRNYRFQNLFFLSPVEQSIDLISLEKSRDQKEIYKHLIYTLQLRFRKA
jgi:hypothetical protein